MVYLFSENSQMTKSSYYIVNGITVYRIVAAPVLIILILKDQAEVFKWMLMVSFFTDLIDGFLARKFNVISVLGTKLDSIADDLTIVAAIVGLFVLKADFIKEEIVIIGVMFVFYLTQTILAFVRYGKLSGFHTYSAKVAAIFQGTFLILMFLLPDPLYPLFYAAAILTTIDLLEEITLIILLPKWKADVKGVYWVMKEKSKRRNKKITSTISK